MSNQNEYVARAAHLLSEQLKQKGIGLKELSARLYANGITISDTDLRKRIDQGTFSAAFLLQCLEAAGVFTLRMEPRNLKHF